MWNYFPFGLGIPVHISCLQQTTLGIIGSHSRKGNCYYNACIESFFSQYKSDMVYLNHFKTEEDLIQANEEYIYLYKYKRFQKLSNHRAPIEYRISMVA
ncbi:IS3 family transposase [Bacillus bombysepticus]